ncbi:unnamed protein product, partial [Ectocarpus sp. 12 AP-2014]
PTTTIESISVVDRWRELSQPLFSKHISSAFVRAHVPEHGHALNLHPNWLTWLRLRWIIKTSDIQIRLWGVCAAHVGSRRMYRVHCSFGPKQTARGMWAGWRSMG